MIRGWDKDARHISKEVCCVVPIGIECDLVPNDAKDVTDLLVLDRRPGAIGRAGYDGAHRKRS